ncbi:uncharacterized protein LOC115326889 isoform X2 [Ixodes scapularis]|uniref:uncharacterized protein LOC115326889 isoform X2 n=1 Tax=Ixodes scapularis TaxID=6945 RepID=UPI001A9EC54A|nr:uncharacterized protein LOC115326889 isoform X2 [Ixodes scapularis]
MAYLTHCCCGCMTVRTGTKVLAILSVMDALVGIIIYATFLVYQKEVAEVFDDLPSIKSSVEVKVGEFVAYIVIGVIGVIVSSLCVRGAYTDQRHYILPYLVFDFMVLVVQGILVIWLIIVVIANCYFYVVVLSFYKQLANAAHNPGICMVPADQPVSRGTYVPPRSYSSTAPEPQCYSDSKVALV